MEALIRPIDQEVKLSGVIAVEAWSRTVIPTSTFTSAIDTGVWDLKPGEEWKAIPDEQSQANFKIFPGHKLAFPGSFIRAKSPDGKVIRMKDREIVNDNDEPIVITMEGVRLQVDRAPDEQSAPIEPVDIDNWR